MACNAFYAPVLRYYTHDINGSSPVVVQIERFIDILPGVNARGFSQSDS
ncbi:hypothetical protein CKA32_006998 [Geitlerinema sp. FC II]|nr:hypothetical protein CKA32_006998 [Geitlerinema sp. FC II]